MTYLSAGTRIVGYLLKPANVEGKKLPLFIYSKAEDQIDADRLFLLSLRVLGSGFVVLTTEYRGHGGSEGQDEFGGADVNDVLSLIPLARSLGYVEMDRTVMYGGGRGALMIYLALKHGMPLTTAIAQDAPSDINLWAQEQPDLLHTFRQTMPDFDKRAEEHYRERSAINWPEKLNVPLLIVHTKGDARLRSPSVSHSLALAQRLEALGRKYRLIVYEDQLSVVDADKDARVRDWLSKFKMIQ